MRIKIRICQNCKNQFTIEPEDFLFYEKIKVPPPTWCPDCRKQRRLAWRNDFFLYSRLCDLCKKSIVSVYPPSAKRVIYCSKCWWSDKWDSETFARDIDFSRPFFEQFKDLQEKVPAIALMNDDGVTSVNCEYTHDFAFGKNCYLCFLSWNVENSLYSVYLDGVKDIVDSMGAFENSEYIYDSIDVDASYRCKYTYHSINMRESSFCYDCRDSQYCFMSMGLRYKQYCVRNVQYSREEYEKILTEYRLDTFSGIEQARKEFSEFILMHPRKFAEIVQSIHSTGDILSQSKNVSCGFNTGTLENSKYIQDAERSKDGYDICVGGEWAECYESNTPDQSYRDLFTIYSWKNTDVTYSDNCHSSKYLFGCVGVKKGQYQILNRRYLKEEYGQMREKVIEHMTKTEEWGEFFPASGSPVGYNISSANIYYPLEKEEALSKGFTWEEFIQLTQGKETLSKIPESIHDIAGTIIKETLTCQTCSRNYKIVSNEFAFYKSMNIPIPRQCFYCRNLARFAFRNTQKLWHRVCLCSGAKSKNGVYKNQSVHLHGAGVCLNEFETPYSEDRPEIVYCEQCYQNEVV